MIPNNEIHNHHLKSRHEQLVDAMWEEARTYWICSNSDDTCTIDEHAAKQLLRGIQLESITTKPLPIPSPHSRVSAAEKLELTFRLPTQNGSNKSNSNNLYRWFVSWYDIHGPDVAVAGSLRCQPFVEDPPFENVIMHHINTTTSANTSSNTNDNNNHQQVWEQVDEEHYQQAHQIRKGGWNLQPLDNWKTECAQWLVGAGLLASDIHAAGNNSSIPLETVARLVTAGVGVLARDALATNKNNNFQHQHNHEAFMIHTATSNGASSQQENDNETSSSQNHQTNWVLRKLMLRLERELKSWNNPHAKDPKEMEVLESIQRRGGLMSHPRVVEAIKRENRWNQPVLPSS
jgi:hypothetical protein